MIRARAALVVATCLVAPLAACGKDPGTPAGSPTPATTRTASAAASVDPTMAPTAPPEGTEFTFDQAARYDDGVLVEVDDIHAAKATATQQGAEGTSGDVVLVGIVVTNRSTKPFVTDQMVVSGYYAKVGAPKLVDSSGAVGDSFKGTVPAGGQARAAFGFAIPADQLDEVTIMVDGGDDAHGPVQFTGKVTKP